MALASLLEPLPLLGAAITALVTLALYRVFFHPLSHIPGPFIAKITSLYLYRLSYDGVEASTIAKLHEQYGPVVRVAPNEVDIDDGRAINPIYVRNGGMLKNPCYANFHIDGFATIFSALDPVHRAVRSKAVVGMFAPAAIRENKQVIRDCVERMVVKIKRETSEAKGQPINMLNSTRSLALDAVTAYLFHRPYNGIMESKLSASEFVDLFVAVGRFFYVPNWLFHTLELWETRWQEGKKEVWTSVSTVDRFVAGLVDDTIRTDNAETDTYQAKLLAAGISREETMAQCKDLMFAGTDSTGMNLASICWYLARQPDTYTKLQAEVLENADADPQTLPYLAGVIKEGLRLSMANPTRLPRIAGPAGMDVPGLPTIPPGTSVGVSAYSVHLNKRVFTSPHEFRPERWEKPTEEMLRNSFGFGAGPRQCIARNLATAELFYAVHAIARENLLAGATAVQQKIEILEWFNSKVVGEKIELRWPVLSSS